LFSPKSFVFPYHIKELKVKIYRTVILPVVLYGCETWSLTFKEKHRFLRTELRRIFGPKREEVGSWRKLHNDELYSLYFSPIGGANFIQLPQDRVQWWAFVNTVMNLQVPFPVPC
jgi:hypothetical protein